MILVDKINFVKYRLIVPEVVVSRGIVRLLAVIAFVPLTACEHFSFSSKDTKASPSEIVRAPLTRKQAIERLLIKAERALTRDRLLNPVHDNAYDHYASVLLVDPLNKSAELGMHAIILRYVDLARNAAQSSRFKEAQAYLDRALSVRPNDSGVQELVQNLRNETKSPPVLQLSDNAIGLDSRLLEKRSILMVEQLGLIAHQVKRQGSSLIIVARSDAEGRWIYQQMREAVSGFLLRGDIRVGSPTRIELLPPI